MDTSDLEHEVQAVYVDTPKYNPTADQLLSVVRIRYLDRQEFVIPVLQAAAEGVGHEHPLFCMLAVEALVQLRDPTLIAYWTSILRGEKVSLVSDLDFKKEAIFALAKIDTREAVASINPALDDKSIPWKEVKLPGTVFLASMNVPEARREFLERFKERPGEISHAMLRYGLDWNWDTVIEAIVLSQQFEESRKWGRYLAEKHLAPTSPLGKRLAQRLKESEVKMPGFWEGSGCFIATAATGNADAQIVADLRTYRDEYLLQSPAGRMFVSTYERLSPPVARWIGGSVLLRRVVLAVFVRPAALIANRAKQRRR